MWILDGGTLASLMKCTAAVNEAIPLPRIQTSRDSGSRETVLGTGVDGREENRDAARDGGRDILYQVRIISKA
jgi:hypothetical protein